MGRRWEVVSETTERENWHAMIKYRAGRDTFRVDQAWETIQ